MGGGSKQSGDRDRFSTDQKHESARDSIASDEAATEKPGRLLGRRVRIGLGYFAGLLFVLSAIATITGRPLIFWPPDDDDAQPPRPEANQLCVSLSESVADNGLPPGTPTEDLKLRPQGSVDDVSVSRKGELWRYEGPVTEVENGTKFIKFLSRREGGVAELVLDITPTHRYPPQTCLDGLMRRPSERRWFYVWSHCGTGTLHPGTLFNCIQFRVTLLPAAEEVQPQIFEIAGNFWMIRGHFVIVQVGGRGPWGFVTLQPVSAAQALDLAS